MAGYIRADVTSQISDGNTIDALPLNQEFDAVEAAFDAISGHRHDGTAAEGAPITVVGPAQDIVVTASVLRPKTDNAIDLGTSSLEFKDLWIDGTANIDSLVADTVDINAGTIDATVIGGTTPAAVTTTSLVATIADINGGTADSVVLGASVPAAATVTTLAATSGTVGGAPIATTTGSQTLTNKTINLANNTLTATSAQIAAAVTDETGTGSLVFSNSPTFTGTAQLAGANFSGNTNFNGTTTDFNSTTVDFNGTVVDFNTVSWQFTGASSLNLQNNRSALDAAATPKTATGVGQFVLLTAAANTNLVLPASGSWLWWIIQRNSSTLVVNDVSTGISAGGSTIFAATAGVDTRGWAWRIA